MGHHGAGRSPAVLEDPLLNKDTAFSREERAKLGLDGLIPPVVETLEEQASRAYTQYARQPTDLAKSIFLSGLQDRNEVLFYRLPADHLREMLPIVYDPTIAQVIKGFSREYRRPRGVYLTVDDPGGIERAFDNFGLGEDQVDLIVASDAEQILGIGDWGLGGGAGIAAGKLTVYTAAAGIDPARVIPVALDAGTDNEALLNDPFYVGERHARVRGERYDAFIEAYVRAATRLFPKALLHWEDFGPSNARRLLERYTGRFPTFNDDMQGTGAIVLAALLGAVRATGTSPTDRIEAMPQDLIRWTEGRALIATGVPFEPIAHNGVDHVIGQANNALLYPGVGLGAVVSRASRVSDGMLRAAAEAVAGLVDVSAPGASLLPQVENLRQVSATVAVAVARQAAKEGLARVELGNPVQQVQDAMWQPRYRP